MRGVPKKGKRDRAARGGAKAASAAVTLDDLSAEQLEVLESLRALRTSISKREKVPAYVVFADRTLREMAREKPQSAGALGDVFGVGPAKMEKYGEEFLAVLREA